MSEYIIKCDLCGFRGHYTNLKFYDISGKELIDTISHPNNINSICIDCYHEVISNNNFWYELEEINNRLEIGL
jgi:hypothetical protein